MRPSVLSRVMPALWTTIPAPPWRSRRCVASVAGASAEVMSSCSELPPMRFAVRLSSSPMAPTSRQTTSAPSRASTSAIEAPMPRDAPVTSATCPASGCAQSSGSRCVALPHADDLAVDVGRARREQKAQRGLGVGLGARRDVDQLRGGAAADLLADRAHEALERALRRGGARRRRHLGRGAEHEHAAVGLHLADHRVQEVVDGAQLRGVLDAGGVEDQRAVAGVLVGGGRDLRAALAQQQRDDAVEPAARRGAEQRRPGQQRLIGLVAAQRRRLRQPQAAGE